MYKVYDAISPVVNKMEPKERGIIVAYLLYGKDLENKNITKDELLKLGTEFDASKISQKLNDAFRKGLGVIDEIAGRDDNYGLQIDYCINEVLYKALEKSKPLFRHGSEEWDGIIEREQWIVNTFIERFWDGLKEEYKLELLKGIEDELKESGINYKNIVKRVMQGQATITLLRSLMGFRFHILLAQITNLIAKAIFERGLSVTANAALQSIAAKIFGGPVGWIFFVLTIILTIPGLLKPREWDKFIPVVLLIGLYRAYLQKYDKRRVGVLKKLKENIILIFRRIRFFTKS
jgi:uncharacterized protein YaaW (UPF0174 family)